MPIDATQLIRSLASIAGQIGALPKEGRNNGMNFSFVGVNQMTEAARPLLAEAGIIIYPHVIRDMSHDVGQTSRGTAQTEAYLLVQFQVTDGVSFIEIETPGEAHDTGDKAFNKAMTAAYKNCLSKLLMIGADEDNDANSGDARQVRGQDVQAQQRAPRAQAPSKPQYGTCEQHNIEFFKTENMRSPAHRPAVDGDRWCDMPAQDWEWFQKRDKAMGHVQALSADPEARRQWVNAALPDMAGVNPQEWQADDYDRLIAIASAAELSVQQGGTAADVLPDFSIQGEAPVHA